MTGILFVNGAVCLNKQNKKPQKHRTRLHMILRNLRRFVCSYCSLSLQFDLYAIYVRNTPNALYIWWSKTCLLYSTGAAQRSDRRHMSSKLSQCDSFCFCCTENKHLFVLCKLQIWLFDLLCGSTQVLIVAALTNDFYMRSVVVIVIYAIAATRKSLTYCGGRSRNYDWD